MSQPLPGAIDVAGLLARAAAGDEVAFAQVYDATAPRVYGLVLRVVRDPALAEQVTREVFLQAWRSAHEYDDSASSPATWLLVSAHRRAVDSVRASEVEAAPAPPPRTVAPAAPAVPGDTHTRVRAALDQLSGSQRESVELAYFGGYTHTEVDLLVGGTPGAARSEIGDGLRRLRGLLLQVA